MLSTSGDEVIGVASPLSLFYTCYHSREATRSTGEKKWMCRSTLLDNQSMRIVVGVCRGVDTFLMLISLCTKAFVLEQEVRRESWYSRETNFPR